MDCPSCRGWRLNVAGDGHSGIREDNLLKLAGPLSWRHGGKSQPGASIGFVLIPAPIPPALERHKRGVETGMSAMPRSSLPTLPIG